MQVSYTVTLDDVVACQLHAYRKSPTGRAQFYRGWLIPPFALAGLALALAGHSLWVAAVCLVLVALALLALYPMLFWGRVESGVRRFLDQAGTRGVVGRITLVLSDETLTEVTEVDRSEARWRDMAGVEEVGEATYIFVTPLKGAILPRRGFEREEDYEAARDFAFSKLGRPG